jgi:hypothetical protein
MNSRAQTRIGRADAIDLLLKQAWVQSRPARRKPVSQAMRKKIEQYSERWSPPLPISARDEQVLRELLGQVPRRLGEAANTASALSLLIVWWCAGDRSIDVNAMLSARSLRDFRDALAGEAYPQGTCNAYCAGLNELAKSVNPNQDAEWSAMGSTPTRKAGYSREYTDAQVWAYFELAWAQPTQRLRDGLLGLLYPTLGVGLYAKDVHLLRGDHVRQDVDGGVFILVGQRWLPVRPRYARGLAELADRLGRAPLVPGATGKNKTGPLFEDLVIPHGTAAPTIPRLAATYRWWLAEQLRFGVFVEQCGSNALVHAADLYRRRPPQSMPDTRKVMVTPEEVTDGPWAFDWPARQHRGATRGRSRP